MKPEDKWCFYYSPKKRRYRDRLDAHIALAMLIAENNPHRHEDRYYYHKLCKGFHLTSMSKDELAKIKRVR